MATTPATNTSTKANTMSAAAKMTPAEVAQKFLTAAKAGGWGFSAGGEVVTITRRFAPNDNAAFVACDMDYYDILSILGAKGGSMWGTDGGGIGGCVALQSGFFKMNVSGVGKRVVAAINKIQG